MPQVRGRELEFPATVAELGPGLLVFWDRPSWLQSWAEVFGHEWRHVAFTIETDNGIKLVNYGLAKMDHLLPLDVLFGYRRVAVAKVFTEDAEVERLERWLHDVAHTDDKCYTTSGPVVGPIHLIARRLRPGLRRRLLFSFIRLYCRAMTVRHREHAAFCCSTYVWAAINACRNEPLRIPLSEHPDDLAAYATPTTEIDDLLGRWLCGPTELWRAISPANRCDLDLTIRLDAPMPDEVVIDLRSAHPTGELALDRSEGPPPASHNIDLGGEFIIDLTDRARAVDSSRDPVHPNEPG